MTLGLHLRVPEGQALGRVKRDRAQRECFLANSRVFHVLSDVPSSCRKSCFLLQARAVHWQAPLPSGVWHFSLRCFLLAPMAYLTDDWCCLLFLEELVLAGCCLITWATPTFKGWAAGRVT